MHQSGITSDGSRKRQTRIMMTREEYTELYNSGEVPQEIEEREIVMNINNGISYQIPVKSVSIKDTSHRMPILRPGNSIKLYHLDSITLSAIHLGSRYWQIDGFSLIDEELLYVLNISKEDLMYLKMKHGYTGTNYIDVCNRL